MILPLIIAMESNSMLPSRVAKARSIFVFGFDRCVHCVREKSFPASLALHREGAWPALLRLLAG
jgi:hypothetical protein